MTHGRHPAPDEKPFTAVLLFLPKMHNLNLIMGKHQDNPHGKTVFKNNQPLLITRVKAIKTKKTEKLSQIGGD